MNCSVDLLDNRPKYSVIIPTRNRREYLGYAIDSVVSQGRQDVELIVSNNYSTDGTADYLRDLSDFRVKVIMPPIEMTMSEHYEYAISQATGEWVTILGDDDAVMPDCFARLDVIIQKHAEASIISSERAYYFWEGCEDIYGDVVTSYRGRSGIKERSTKGDLIYALAGIRSCFDMPQIYTSCIVKSSLINKIKRKTGNRFYHSIIPDMYSVVALCLAEDRYIRVNDPLFWTGTSNKSMSRGRRIYDDTNLSGKDENRSALNENISIDLHSAGFGSLYLYEALLQCPLSSGTWRGKLVASIVYSSLVISVRRRRKEFKDKKSFFLNMINNEIEANELSSRFVAVLIFAIMFLSSVLAGLSVPGRLWRKITKQNQRGTVFSTSRSDYPDIMSASIAVRALRASRKSSA